MPDNIYPDLTNSKYDIRYSQALGLLSDVRLKSPGQQITIINSGIVVDYTPPPPDDGERIEYPAGGNVTYALPLHYLLQSFIIFPGTDADVKVGSSAGGEQYFPETHVLASEGLTFVINLYANVAKTIYISGLTAGSAIVYFKRFVKQPP